MTSKKSTAASAPRDKRLFLFSLTVPNFNAMAMEPLGAIAGTASSFIGSYG